MKQYHTKRPLIALLAALLLLQLLTGCLTTSREADKADSQSMIRQQQPLIEQWLKQYQINFDHLTNIARRFHETTQQLESNTLSRSEAASQFTDLLADARIYAGQLDDLRSVSQLSPNQYYLINSIVDQTKAAWQAHLYIIETTITMLNNNSIRKKSDLMAEIKKLTILYQPVYLDIVPKLSQLKASIDNVSKPPESATNKD